MASEEDLQSIADLQVMVQQANIQLDQFVEEKKAEIFALKEQELKERTRLKGSFVFCITKLMKDQRSVLLQRLVDISATQNANSIGVPWFLLFST